MIGVGAAGTSRGGMRREGDESVIGDGAGSSGAPEDSDRKGGDSGSAPYAKPPTRQWRLLALVTIGGTIGTAARAGVSLAFPSQNGLPVTIFVINLVGAFLLGLLVAVLSSRGPDVGRRREVRLLLGTGVLGGFTTYSALATDAAGLSIAGAGALGLGYGLATVVVGVGCSWAGLVLGSALSRGRGARDSVGPGEASR